MSHKFFQGIAAIDELTKKYRQLAVQLHPDKVSEESKQDATEKFQEVIYTTS